jgi:drug/metabolite transporter (DMT)-like permease
VGGNTLPDGKGETRAMWIYYAAIILTIVSSVFYHVIQKSTPSDVNPILSISVTYIVALILCLIAYPFFSADEGIVSAVKKLNWTSYALGTAIFGIEMGFLLAYRAGWNISLANIMSAATVTLILIVIGMLSFHEQLTVAKTVGVLLCLAGIALIK